jgi:hypothetical protein
MENGTIASRWRVVLEPRPDGGVSVNLETDTPGVTHAEVLRHVLAAAAAIAEHGIAPLPTREEEARALASAQVPRATVAFFRGSVAILLCDTVMEDVEAGCTVAELLHRYGWRTKRLPDHAAAFPCALSLDRAGTLARITSE